MNVGRFSPSRIWQKLVDVLVCVQILIPWQEEENLWLSWSQSVKLHMTKEVLLKMQSHKIVFRLWDTKNKVCTRAKYDRAFRFTQSELTGDMMDSEQLQSGNHFFYC